MQEGRRGGGRKEPRRVSDIGRGAGQNTAPHQLRQRLEAAQRSEHCAGLESSAARGRVLIAVARSCGVGGGAGAPGAVGQRQVVVFGGAERLTSADLRSESHTAWALLDSCAPWQEFGSVGYMAPSAPASRSRRTLPRSRRTAVSMQPPRPHRHVAQPVSSSRRRGAPRTAEMRDAAAMSCRCRHQQGRVQRTRRASSGAAAWPRWTPA